jgi:tRNA modification GTPase
VVAQKGDLVAKPPPWAEVVVSAKEGWGVEELWARLLAAFPRPGDVPTTNQRHLALLREAEALLRFRGDEPLDVVLSAVEAALDALMRLTGEAASEAILAEIFSRFCLGK